MKLFKGISYKKLLFLSAVLGVCFWCALPNPLFDDPTCTVLKAGDGQLLGAKIAPDGQWRFPYNEQVPDKFEKAILAFEDKRFYQHFGIDLKAVGRAIQQNFKQKRIVSGASTISMQVIRLSRKGKARTYWQKLLEAILTLRMELGYSKQHILSLYASNAPFGGNVVGLDAASWRYYQKPAALLSWSEAATLAVLPNSPALIHPGRNRSSLKEKRDRLLHSLHTTGQIDSDTYQLSLEEPLPEKPYPLPRLAPHLLDYFAKKGFQGQVINSSIKSSIQLGVNNIVKRRHQLLKNNEIHNLAVVVIDVKKNQVMAYVGNADGAGKLHGQTVDIVQANRSTGSILKPFLYAFMNQEGMIAPHTLVPDIPVYLNDFRPENYYRSYDGVVPASDALARSLNIPFVKLLQEYSVQKFHFALKKHGISSLKKAPDHYGLSLILGGAEASLWELTNFYASMAQRLNQFYPQSGWYQEDDFETAKMLSNSGVSTKTKLVEKTSFLDAAAIWLTFEAMTDLKRPTAEGSWKRFQTARKIAWKTGTSYGFRDAWAIGVNPEYAIGVWVGNADGEGRPGLTGFQAAAPVLFDVFNLLPDTRWFDPPYDELKQIEICSKSGQLAQTGCPIDSVWASQAIFQSESCKYHELVYLDPKSQWQVNASCGLEQAQKVYWFNLPPLEAHYYKTKHPAYQPLPKLHPSCKVGQSSTASPIELVYPPPNAKILVPIELDGNLGKSVFQAIHEDQQATLYWHIDRAYIGSTQNFHELEVSPSKGKHLLVIVDEEGNRLEQTFEILEKSKK